MRIAKRVRGGSLPRDEKNRVERCVEIATTVSETKFAANCAASRKEKERRGREIERKRVTGRERERKVLSAFSKTACWLKECQRHTVELTTGFQGEEKLVSR